MHRQRQSNTRTGFSPSKSQRHKLGVIVYSLVYIAVVWFAFRLPEFVSPLAILWSLVSLYAVAMLLVLDDLPSSVGVWLLLATVGVSALIVIDPFEYGLYGWDPYKILNNFEVFRGFDGGLEQFTRVVGERPLIFEVVAVIQAATGLSSETLAKYVPLLTVVLPGLYFGALSRFTSEKGALLAAFGFASVRTLLLFETKLVPELIAVVLLFTLLAVLVTFLESKLLWTLAALLAIEISFAHHLTSFVTALIFSIWAVVYAFPAIVGTDRFDRSFLRERLTWERTDFPSIRALAVLSIVVSASTMLVFAVYEPVIFQRLAASASNIVFGTETAAPTGGTIGQGTKGIEGIQLLLSSYGTIVMIAVLVLINAAAVLTRYENAGWETAWVVCGGALGALFAVFLTIGYIIPLHETRFLTFMFPFVLGVAVHVLQRSERLSLSLLDRQALVVLVVLCFVSTQLAAIPPAVLQSNPDGTIIGEDHNSLELADTSRWTARYSAPTLVGYEGDLWGAYGNDRFVPYGEFSGSCGDGTVLIGRTDAEGGIAAGGRSAPTSAVIYASEDIELGYCVDRA